VTAGGLTLAGCEAAIDNKNAPETAEFTKRAALDETTNPSYLKAAAEGIDTFFEELRAVSVPIDDFLKRYPSIP